MSEHKVKELEMEMRYLEKENSKMQKSIERMIEKGAKNENNVNSSADYV